MPSKRRSDRPAPELRSGRTVEKILKLRTKPMSGVQVAENMGYARNRLSTMVSRIRWMAKVELGGDCPIGAVEQKVAREVLQVWDMVNPNRGKPAREWKPMTAGEGRTVSDAIGKVRKAAARAEG